MKKTYVIGDVHGCFNTLLKLLEQLPKEKDLIFVGDLMDKGNYPLNTMEYVINNNFQCVLGNHEYLFYNYIRDVLFRNKKISNWSNHPSWGGIKTIENYRNNLKIIDKHIKWVEELPSYIEKEINGITYFITHGYGLPYYKRKDVEKSKKSLMSNRIDNDSYKEDWEDILLLDKGIVNVFGHCNFNEVLIDENKQYYGIDTGCVYGNKLTAIELGTMNVFQQEVLEIDIV
jgi:serine/threonine protein phosphatase 1